MHQLKLPAPIQCFLFFDKQISFISCHFGTSCVSHFAYPHPALVLIHQNKVQD